MGRFEELVYYGKLLHEKNMVIGAGGNISVRDGNGMIIKKKDVNMAVCDKEGYVKFRSDVQDSEQEDVSSETPLHKVCYEASKNWGAVIHVHSPYMIAVAQRTKELLSVSYEFDCIIGEKVPVIDYIQPGSETLALECKKEISKGAGTLLLRRHGGLSAGKDLEEAFQKVLALERACIAFLNL